MFYSPRALWRVFNKKSGIAVHTITDAAIERQRKSDPESADKIMRYLIKSMGRFLMELSRDARNTTNTYSRDCITKLAGNYLFGLYVAMKVLYIANVIVQFLLLNSFLSTDYHWYGFEVIKKICLGENWTTSHRFPRVTMCDFKVRRLGATHRYTVQCVLPINLFNEKIYLFVWFWMTLVAAVTVASLVTWLLRIAFRVDRHRYIKKHLYLMDKLKLDTDKKDAYKFVESYLRQDGVFILRLVGHNTNALTVTEFVCSLWDNFRRKPRMERAEGESSDV